MITTTGQDKLGNYWYVESTQPVDVRVCKVCGNPVAILNVSPSQPVQKIRFTKPLVSRQEMTIGEVHLDAIKKYLGKNPLQCSWCGSNA